MYPAHDAAPHSAAPATTMHYLIEAEAHARQAARLVELLIDEDARRDARLLILAAQRLRARRLEGAAP